jgi:hypothetical protein
MAATGDSNGQPQNTKAKNQQTDIEELVLEQINLLKNKERIIQLELPAPCGSFFEADLVLTVNFAEKNGAVSSNFFTFFLSNRESVK